MSKTEYLEKLNSIKDPKEMLQFIIDAKDMLTSNRDPYYADLIDPIYIQIRKILNG